MYICRDGLNNLATGGHIDGMRARFQLMKGLAWHLNRALLLLEMHKGKLILIQFPFDIHIMNIKLSTIS